MIVLPNLKKAVFHSSYSAAKIQSQSQSQSQSQGANISTLLKMTTKRPSIDDLSSSPAPVGRRISSQDLNFSFPPTFGNSSVVQISGIPAIKKSPSQNPILPSSKRRQLDAPYSSPIHQQQATTLPFSQPSPTRSRNITDESNFRYVVSFLSLFRTVAPQHKDLVVSMIKAMKDYVSDSTPNPEDNNINEPPLSPLDGTNPSSQHLSLSQLQEEILKEEENIPNLSSVVNLNGSPIRKRPSQSHNDSFLSPTFKTDIDSDPVRVNTVVSRKKVTLLDSSMHSPSQIPQSQSPSSSPTKHSRSLIPASQSKSNISNNNEIFNVPFKPLVAIRGISTTRKSNATIELMTQRQTLFSMNNKSDDNNTDQETVKKEAKNREGSPAVKVVKAVTLSEEQSKVIELARQGANIFYTGSAGTGKSLLLRSLIKALRSQHSKGSVGVTASTGLAACNIGGQTLNSFAGIGLGTGSANDLIKKIKRSKKSKERWVNLKVLIVDEISMIEGELFDKLDSIAKALRRNNLPFGGVQLVICGDFYQLPPVTRGREPVFAFESQSWKQSIKYTIVLQKVFRQQSDRDFINMLNEVRNGQVTPQTARKFAALSRPLPPRDGVIPAQLYPTRKEVEMANNRMLRDLPGKIVTFRAVDGGSVSDPEVRGKLLSNFMAPDRINLKKNAQVMMIKNLDETLVNGSLGKVVDFIDPDTYSFYKTSSTTSYSDQELERMVKVNSAKNDGKRLIEDPEGVESDLDDDIFPFLDEIVPLSEKDVIPESVVKGRERKREQMRQLRSASKGRAMPLVRFILADGSTREVLVEPETFSVEDEFEKPLVSRTQIPLILAWSLSIHKSQGQTLPMVKIDLRRIFEKGQAYVALSRAINRRGLQVNNFDPAKIQTHDRVVEFYKLLKTVDEITGGTEHGLLPSTDIRRLEDLMNAANQIDPLSDLKGVCDYDSE